MPYYYDDERGGPRKTEGGIPARNRRGGFAEHWWAERWIKSLERITDAGRLRRGRSYARGGQVQSIKEAKGQIEARVQGSRPTPYKVTIRLQPLTDVQWEAVFEALSEQAIFSAQLLAGEMPNEIEEAFTAAGVSLFPSTSEELETTCTCPDWANPCKHVAAVHYILGEQFDEDPFMIFRLRGRSQEQVMAALRARRQRNASAVPGVAEEPASYTPGIDEGPAVVPLAETLANFWQMGQTLDHFPTAIQAPAQPYPVLRRLGPAPFARQLEVSLGPAYQAMTGEALRLAFSGDGPETSGETESETGGDTTDGATDRAEA